MSAATSDSRAKAQRSAAGQAVHPETPSARRARAVDSSTATRRSPPKSRAIKRATRSEEHTSELQSRGHLVCRLLLEKKKDSEAGSPPRTADRDPPPVNP